MVEFALVLPILMIVLLGIVDFGRAWNAHQVITDAAREATRRMVVAGPPATDESVRAAVTDALRNAGLKATPTITLTGLRAGTGTMARVEVAYPYTFTFLGPIMKWTTDRSNITLRTSFVMRNE